MNNVIDGLSAQQLIDLAHKVELLKTDQTFRALMLATENGCHREWEKADTTEAREKAHAKLLGVREMERQIEVILQRGEAAAKSLRPRKVS